MPKCDICGKEVRTEQGLNAHRTRVHDTPWSDKEVLKDLYLDKQMNAVEIAEKFYVNKATILRWLEHHDIQRRDNNVEIMRVHSSKPASFKTGFRGYEKWKFKHKDRYIHIPVHRLLAVSEFGLDALDGKVVHHKNGVKWDNRPDNIELLTGSEHSKEHVERGDIFDRKVNSELCKELNEMYPDKSSRELGEMYGIAGSTVLRHTSGKCSH